MIFLILFYLLLIISIFINDYRINSRIIVICLYFIFKWLTNYDKCTFVYMESKLRNIHPKKTFIYNSINEVKNENKCKEKYYIYIFTLCVVIINLKYLKT
jgi:hypothetical protein